MFLKLAGLRAYPKAGSGGVQGVFDGLASRGSEGCADDADWLYDAGDKGLKGCDHIASEPAKVEKRCSRRVSEDGVPALEACKQTCGKC